MKQTINNETYERILRWCEGSLSEAEVQLLQDEMDQDDQLKQEALSLQQVYALGQEADFHFKPFLAGRVLHQLSDNQADDSISQSLQFAFQRLALPAFAIMLLLLAFTFIGEQSLSLEAVIGTADLGVEDVYSQYLISL